MYESKPELLNNQDAFLSNGIAHSPEN